MKVILSFILLMSYYKCNCQELFVFTEPASNMAVKSMGIRLNNQFLKLQNTNEYIYQNSPEIMWGISKKMMLHVSSSFMVNHNFSFWQQSSVYAKYRFYSSDDIHSHFRMAAFANYSLLNIKNLNTYIPKTGYAIGFIATRLKNKIAYSTTLSYQNLPINKSLHYPYFNYSASIGKLMLPKEYVSYKQTNVNLMLEILGQTNVNNSQTSIDAAPSIQFIVNSKMRFDFGYRFSLINSIQRTYNSQALIRFEYNLFNLY